MTQTANYYAAIDDEGTVWGIGATIEDALADVRETVSGSDDETASLLDDMLVHRITERMRNHVQSGNTQFATRVLDDGTLDLDVDPHQEGRETTQTATTTTYWSNLDVYDNSGVCIGSLDDIVADRDNTSADYIVVALDGSLYEWAGHFVAAEGEDPDADTPSGPVDWTGFAAAIDARRTPFCWYEISDGIVLEHCEAISMDEAERYAEESWSGADPGVYEIEIREYASSDAYEDGAAPLDTRNITVSV